MMNPYQLNWPGLRDVPIVTIESETGNIYSQENLLPIKRGKLDRIEYKYVPIEAVLDEFNAEIELEEAFETLTSILEIPGVKPLYTDKSSGRKYVHVSSLLALIVVRPEDGPGFEMACNGILHFLTNHMEMACLECGYIRRDCLCQDFDICYDRSNIECVSFVKQTMDKDIQTDPVMLEGGGGASDNGLRPGNATTVYLPPGANLADCARLPDGRLNIRYITGNKGEPIKTNVLTGPRPMQPATMVSSMAASGMPPGMLLPPISPYSLASTIPSFMPPVCHTGLHSNFIHSSPYILPPSSTPIGSIPTMMHLPSSAAMAYPHANPYTPVRAYAPYMTPVPSVPSVIPPQPVKSIIRMAPPSTETPAAKKRSPTPTGNKTNNGTEAKRKRENGSSSSSSKENQLKVKLRFVNCSGNEGKRKQCRAKRMKKPQDGEEGEDCTEEKSTEIKKNPAKETKEKKKKPTPKETAVKRETSSAVDKVKPEIPDETGSETTNNVSDNNNDMENIKKTNNPDKSEQGTSAKNNDKTEGTEERKKKKVPTATLR